MEGLLVLRDCGMVLAEDGVLSGTSLALRNGVVECIGCRPDGGKQVDCRGYLVLPCPYDAYAPHGVGRGACGGLEPGEAIVMELAGPEDLDRLARITGEACGDGRRVVVYASTRRSQVFLFKKKTGMFPVEALADHNLLSPCTVLYNPVWVSSWELRQVADAGAAVAVSPSSWLGEPGGFFPIREAVDHGITVGIGSGEHGHDIWLEATLLHHAASTVYGEPVDPRIVLAALIQGGARIAAHTDNPLYIREGARLAGIALLRLDHHTGRLIERYGVEEALVRLGTGAAVKTIPVGKTRNEQHPS